MLKKLIILFLLLFLLTVAAFLVFGGWAMITTYWHLSTLDSYRFQGEDRNTDNAEWKLGAQGLRQMGEAAVPYLYETFHEKKLSYVPRQICAVLGADFLLAPNENKRVHTDVQWRIMWILREIHNTLPRTELNLPENENKDVIKLLLAGILNEDLDQRVQEEALNALNRHPNEADLWLYDVGKRLFRSRNEDLKRKAEQAFRDCPRRDWAVENLCRIAQDREGATAAATPARLAAVKLLAEEHWRSQCRASALEPLIDVMANDEMERVRRQAAVSLLKITEGMARPPANVVAAFCQAIGRRPDDDWCVRYLAVHALASFQKPGGPDGQGGWYPPEAVAPLLLRVQDHRETPFVRLYSIVVLGNYRDTAAIDPLIAELQDRDTWDDPNLAWRLIWALGRIPDPERRRAVEPILAYHNHPDKWVKLFVTYSLHQLGDPEAVPTLVRMLGPGEDYQVRKNALITIGDLEAIRSVPELLRATRDPEPFIRRIATAILGVLQIEPESARGQEVIQRFFELLSDESEFVRADAAWALGFYPSNALRYELFPNLIDRLGDDSEIVRLEAHRSLCYFREMEKGAQSMEPLGFVPRAPAGDRAPALQRWREWWEEKSKSPVRGVHREGGNFVFREGQHFPLFQFSEREYLPMLILLCRHEDRVVRHAAWNTIRSVLWPENFNPFAYTVDDTPEARAEAVQRMLDWWLDNKYYLTFDSEWPIQRFEIDRALMLETEKRRRVNLKTLLEYRLAERIRDRYPVLQSLEDNDLEDIMGLLLLQRASDTMKRQFAVDLTWQVVDKKIGLRVINVGAGEDPTVDVETERRNAEFRENFIGQVFTISYRVNPETRTDGEVWSVIELENPEVIEQLVDEREHLRRISRDQVIESLPPVTPTPEPTPTP